MKIQLTTLFVVLQVLTMPALAQREQDLQTILGLGLPVVVVNTEGGEEPTCDLVEPPEGCMGQGITNMNKVKGRPTTVPYPTTRIVVTARERPYDR